MNRPRPAWRRAGGVVCFLVGLGLVLLLGWSRPGVVAGAAPEPGRAQETRRRFKIPRRIVAGFPVPRNDPAKVAIGERLFLETRFSQFYFKHAGTNANATLAAGDPVVNETMTLGRPLPGPFAGFAINCRACHLVNEHFATGHGNRTYADYAERPPVPAREDGKTRAARNSPAMVNATVPRERGFFLHFDGEFGSGDDLVRATLTGRNYGWLPGEQATAVRHIARVIREDDGRGPLAAEFGGYSYRQVFAGTDPALGEESEDYHLPLEYRLELSQATDGQILDAVARLISAYMDSLFFSLDESAEHDSAPYDWFLETNRLPRKADAGQSDLYYARNLLDTVNGPHGLRWIGDGTRSFKTLSQPFRFGPEELAGMKIFFTLATSATNSGARPTRGVGNCVACHRAPHFTDFAFHNTGAAQEEYDALHGPGAFSRLAVPGLAERMNHHDDWLPPTARHPQASGRFLDIPAADRPGRTDLGLWNVFANPEHPEVQSALRELLREDVGAVGDEALLPLTLARFKTPSLRGLAFSDPYLHTGRKRTLEEVIEFYRRMSRLARAGTLRNAAPELSGIQLAEEDIAALAAFLRSLNEDYE